MFLVNSKNLHKTQEIFLLSTYFMVLVGSEWVRLFVINPDWVTPHMSGLLAALVEPLWKLLFWIAPTYLYIHFIEGQTFLTYLKLSTNILKGLLWGFLGMVVIALLEVPSIIVNTHALRLNPGIDTWVNVILLVGFMEEIPFRGFLFQKLQGFVNIWSAGIISSFLFVLLHVPIWVSMREHADIMLFQALLLMGLALLFCVARAKSHSLWSSIIIHTFYNTLQTLFL